MSLVDDVLTFWFETTDLSQEMDKRDLWFKSEPEFDQEIHDRFLNAYEQAARGELDYLKESANGCVALIIMLDQFPRNLFRGSAKSFAADPKAREIARYALEKDYQAELALWPRIFTYLPFEHSEEMADQDLSLSLYEKTGIETAIQAAVSHRDAIVKFGRFPHRNEVLGRQNTPEEEEYLKNPPTWGKTKAELEEMERQQAAEADDA